MKRLTRDVAIATLAQNEVDRLDHGDLINVLIEGCAGWNSKIDEELVEAGWRVLRGGLNTFMTSARLRDLAGGQERPGYFWIGECNENFIRDPALWPAPYRQLLRHDALHDRQPGCERTVRLYRGSSCPHLGAGPGAVVARHPGGSHRFSRPGA